MTLASLIRWPTHEERRMSTATITASGQLTLPAELRRRLGLLAGTQVELIEQPDGIKLVVPRQAEASASAIAACAGMVTAPSKGKPRRLEDFDPATLTTGNAQ
jgi:AbrB family looped-hinge helix DNA binding protein